MSNWEFMKVGVGLIAGSTVALVIALAVVKFIFMPIVELFMRDWS